MTTAPAPAQPGHAGLAGHRDFRLLWLGESTSKLGSSITSVAVPLVAATILHAGTVHVGMLLAASWLPWLLIGLPAGAWVDRLPRRPIMLVCNLVSMTVMASVPVAAWLGLLTIWHLLAVAVLAGTANVFFQTALQVFLPAVLGKELLAEGNARMQGTAQAAHVAGPGIAGLLAHMAGVVSGLLADAATFLASTICLLRMKIVEVRPARRQRAGSLRHDIAQGLRFVARDRYLRIFTLHGAVSNLAMTGYQAILVVYLVGALGIDPGTVGGLMMAMSLGGVIGATIATRLARRLGTAHAILACQFAACPAALLIPLAAPGWRLALVVAGGALIGAGVVVSNVIRSSFRQSYTPRELLGRVGVSMQFLNFGTIPAGALLGGVLGETAGLRGAIWTMTTAVALSPLILLIGPIRKHRDLPPALGASPSHGSPCITRVCQVP